MWRTGLSYEIPYRGSIDILCERPMPSCSRPPTAWLAVSAWVASISGWRGYVGTTDVPRSILGTWWPITDSSVRASWPALWGSQPDVKPAASSWAKRPTISSTGPCSIVGKKIPMRIFISLG